MLKSYNQFNPVIALRIFFVTQSLGLSLWLLRIPEVKAAIGINLIELSLALFMQPLGVLIGFFIAPFIIKKIGNKNSCYFGYNSFNFWVNMRGRGGVYECFCGTTRGRLKN